MSEANEDIDILIEDDAALGSEDQGKKPDITPKPEGAKAPDSLDEGLDTLKKQLEDEKAARAQADQRRQEAENRARTESETAHRAQLEAHDSNLHLVKNAIETVKSQNVVLKGRYAQAMADQDYSAVADIQEEMSSNAARLVQLESGRNALETGPKPERRAQDPIIDPVENVASQLSPRSAAWVRDHPDLITNPRNYQRMIGAHNLAMGEGIEVDSDDYFNRVESILGLGGDGGGEIETTIAPKKRNSPPAAPVSRQANNGSPNPNLVRLTAEEREIAQMNGMTDQEYARNKIALKREGRLN